MERGDSDYVVGLQALLKIRESPGRDSAEVNTTVNVISNGIQSEEEVTRKQVELEDRASDLRGLFHSSCLFYPSEYQTSGWNCSEQIRKTQEMVVQERCCSSGTFLCVFQGWHLLV